MWVLLVGLMATVATPAVAFTVDTSGKLVVACTNVGGEVKFVAMIDRTAQRAKVSSSTGKIRDGYATAYGSLTRRTENG